MKKNKKSFNFMAIKLFKKRINDEKHLKSYSIKKQDFTRKRKFGITNILLYLTIKKGLSSKMEIFNYNNITNTKQVSTVAVFKQREKLDSRIFVDLNDEMMKMFYHKCNKETKKYKDYVLIAIDGSDLEIPNTKATRKEYNGNLQEHCARITVSTCYDILNKYTIDTIIKPYNYSETDMAIEHYNTLNDKNIFGKQKTIFIMDRGYVSLSNMFDVDNGGGKFVIRLSTKGYQEEITKMKTDDEIIEIKPTSLRMNRARKNNPKLYNHFTEGKSVYEALNKIFLLQD